MGLIIWSYRRDQLTAKKKTIEQLSHCGFMRLLMPYGAASNLIVQFGHQHDKLLTYVTNVVMS